MSAPKTVGQRQPPYNEKKATQAAALALKLEGGSMEYEKLVKLLYNIEREALRRWGRLITYDRPFALPQGLILSTTLNKAKSSKHDKRSYWGEHVQTVGFEARLTSDCGVGELSEAEVALITECSERYRDKSAFYMRDEHHRPDIFTEWRDPKGSSIPITLNEILEHLGFNEEESFQILQGIEEDAALIDFVHS